MAAPMAMGTNSGLTKITLLRLGFPTTTSDQFSSFFTKVINTNTRDGVHVIDGLLHHETELDIEEHYTDQVFGLSHLLGFRFAPRLRDLSDAKLYTIQKTK